MSADSDEPQRNASELPDVSRRVFVQQLTFMGGGVVLLGSACQDKKPAAAAEPKKGAALSSSHKTFTNDEWATLSAAVDRMLPRDEDPGALDAGVPEYIDRILQTPQLEQMRGQFVPGLAALNRRAERMHKQGFAQLDPAQQDELLTLFKNSPEKSGEARWYEILVVLVMEGFLGDPSYGGNQGEVGWKLVGFTLVGRNPRGDPGKGYDGSKDLKSLTCGVGRGC
jgi:gluconate 2-dehydrogenase gamma chain